MKTSQKFMMMQNERFQKAISEHDAGLLCSTFFRFKGKPVHLSPKEIEIVRKIAFEESRRLNISAMTRYGKTFAVAVAVMLYILLHNNKQVNIISSLISQSQKLRSYLSQLIVESPILMDMTDLHASGKDRLVKEASAIRQTFKNGCSYQLYTAEGDAMRLMGHGGDLIIVDEAALISRSAYAKILRMLGDDPEHAILVELYNPWSSDSVAIEHSLSDNYDFIRIDWREAVKEGRTTEAYVMEMKESITPIEFQVLYESRPPDQSEWGIFSRTWIQYCKTKRFCIPEAYAKVEERYLNIGKETPKYAAIIKRQFNDFEKIISADIADAGLDETVILLGWRYLSKYQVTDSYHEPKSENMQVASKIIHYIKTFVGKVTKARVIIDSIGIGKGPYSRVKQWVHDNGYTNVRVVGAEFGGGALDKDRFQNLKAENYFRLADIMKEGNIEILGIQTLTSQLMSAKWEFSGTEKIKLPKKKQDGEKSPDWADALVYFVWRDNSGMAFTFA